MSLLAFIAVLATALPAHSARSNSADPAPQRPFAAGSVWNAKVPTKAALASNSKALVSELNRQVRSAGAWINSGQWSTPVYQVPAGEPTQAVRLDTPSDMITNASDASVLSLQLSAVPIPANARPAAGSDHHMVIWQPSTDTLWELWQARLVLGPLGPEWHAAWGSRITSVSTSSGINAPPFGATASGLPMVGGLMTSTEVGARAIPHALALAIPDTAAKRFVWPANRTDGAYTGANAIPEGTHLRLDPTLDIDSLGLPAMTRAIAIAAQRYGIIVRDRAGAVTFYAEDTLGLGLGMDWGRLSPAQLLARFPWTRLQVLDPSSDASRAAARG